MVPTPSDLTREYRALEAAAADLGFDRERELIAGRAAHLDQPFMVYVMGPRGAGKSAVVNALAGREIAAVGAPEPWLNIYRRAESEAEFVELHVRSGSPVSMSVKTTASDWKRRGALGQRRDFDRAVWHVTAPGLPQGVALAEAPCDEWGGVSPAVWWHAGAVIWVMSADWLEPEAASEALHMLTSKTRPPVPAIVVVSHMDVVPTECWGKLLQQIRARSSACTDQVLPFTTASRRGLPVGDLTSLLCRQVRNRFYFSAENASSTPCAGSSVAGSNSRWIASSSTGGPTWSSGAN
jgi:hypothetical protein